MLIDDPHFNVHVCNSYFFECFGSIMFQDAMQPICGLSGATLSGVTCILTDIDDTITTRGRLTARAYAALERLQHAGLRVVPITGRPAGWCDMIARFWPVDGVVGENGAFYMRYDRVAFRMKVHHREEEAVRAENRKRLDALAQLILQTVPGTALASDQAYRIADLAIDFCEDVPPLSDQDVGRIVELFLDCDAYAKVSSIHVNGWFGAYDKLTTSRHFLQQEFGLNEAEMQTQVIYVGDSPNDAPMFAHFGLSVGVANVRRYAQKMYPMPSYITEQESGDGFAELVEYILRNRGERDV